MRISFLTIMPSPYTLDLFEAMEADGRITPRVLYMEMAAPDTYWGRVALPASAEVLRGGWHNIGGGRVHLNLGVVRALARSRPDLVVVAGYSSLTAQIAMHWLRWKRIPWVFWGERPGMRGLDSRGRQLRRLAQRPAVSWPNAIAAIGTGAVEEYRRLARQGCDIVNIPYYTDLKPFLELDRSSRSDRVRILYCGQLIERKGVGTLVDAFINIAGELPQAELHLVGEGPLRESLAERVPAPLRHRVVFAGFQPVERLPHFFQEAELFALPSLHDGWGVVVNQALGAGLPVICSSAVGAAADLVSPSSNGFIVPPGDVSALTEALRNLVSDQERRLAFGANSRSSAENWTPARGVDRWVALAERIVEGIREFRGHRGSIEVVRGACAAGGCIERGAGKRR